METIAKARTPRPRSWQLTVIAIILIVAVSTYLGPILKPLFTAVFLYFLIRPLADWLKRRGCSAAFAYLSLVMFASISSLLMILSLAISAAELSSDWPLHRERILDAAEGWGVRDRVAKALLGFNSEGFIRVLVGTATEAFEFGLMLVFYLLFLTLAAPKLPGRIRRSLPPERAESVLAVGAAISSGMSKYMEVKTTVNFGLAVMVGLTLAGFGVDYWLLWAILMFALNYVTYLGSVVALVPPILLGFLQLSTPYALILTGLLITIRFVWIDVMEVRLSGRHLNIDSLLLLIFIAYWGWFWGLAGIVLAMPMATCVHAGLFALESTRPYALLMNED